MKEVKKCLIYGVTIMCMALIFSSCTHQPYVLPVGMRTGDPNICFESDVLPIFVSNCTRSGCHGADAKAGGYELTSYANITRKGIVPGNYAASKIFEAIAWKTFDVSSMPVGGPGLSESEISIIRQWIQTGAVDGGGCNLVSCDSSNFTYSGAIAPMVQLNCVGCHNSTSSPGGMLTTYALVSQAALNGKLLGNIRHSPGYNAMPPAGTGLSDCQISQFENWVAAGAPNN